MIENQENFHKHGNHLIRKKEIVHEPEVLEEINEVIEKRCCICLEEMRAKTKPEECSHTFCRSCI